MDHSHINSSKMSGSALSNNAAGQYKNTDVPSQGNKTDMSMKKGMTRFVLNDEEQKKFLDYELLRPDLLQRLHASAERADLVLALGTSLSGMHADMLVSAAARRRATAAAGALGSVIVSLQRTPHDASATLRIFAPLDETLRRLCAALGCADALDARVMGQPDARSLDAHIIKP